MVIVAMFGIVAMSNAATTAATEMGINTLAATTVDYVGDFTKVDMNGSTKAPVKDKVTTVVSDGATISSLASWLGIAFDTAVTFEGNE